MAKRDTTGLSLSELTFYEVTQDHLMEHAKSLGGKKAIEAVKYLIKLNERVPLTEVEKQKKREEMRNKTKRHRVEAKDKNGNIIIVNDKIQYEYIETGKKLYSDNKIEEMLNDYKGNQKYSNFKQRQLYCEKYWKEKLPKSAGAQEPTYDEELEALLAELEAGGGE